MISKAQLIGRINVYNILAACAVGIGYQISFEDDRAKELRLVPVLRGDFERVDSGQPFAVVVDYSHTDDALRNALAVARALNPHRIITVFGCGGDRDRRKRPLDGSGRGGG